MNKKNKKQSPLPLLAEENPLKSLFALAEYHPDRVCMAEPRGNMVRKYRLREFTMLIEKVARTVSMTRHSSSKPIAILARSSFRSIVANMGAMLANGRTILIPFNASLEEQLEIIANNQVELLVVDNLRGMQPLLAQLPHLPQLRQLWSLEDIPENYHSEVSTLGWQDILKLAETKKPRLNAQLEQLDIHASASRFYSRTETGEFQFHEFSLAQLADEITEAQRRFTNRYPHSRDLMRFLSVIPFNRATAHIEGVFLPLLTGRALMAVDRQESWRSGALPYAADCLVTSSVFLNQAADMIYTSSKESGGITQFGLQTNLNRLRKLQKRRSESQFDGGGMINFIAGRALNAMLGRKLGEILGGGVKLCLNIDNELTPKASLLYHSIGMPVQTSNQRERLDRFSHSHDEDAVFTGLRGTQLEQDEEIQQFKIVN